MRYLREQAEKRIQIEREADVNERGTTLTEALQPLFVVVRR
jgi:hypothetical protein